MPPRIGPRRPHRLYLVEWRATRGLTQKQLAARLGVSSIAVSRWETKKRKLDVGGLEAWAEALGIEPPDLYRDPAMASADALLRDQPREVQEQAIAIIRAIRK